MDNWISKIKEHFQIIEEYDFGIIKVKGTLMIVIFFILVVLGGYLLNRFLKKAEKEININCVNRYSSTQYIKDWPREFDGNLEINLDNLTSLIATIPRDDRKITFIANVSPEYIANKEEGKFKTEGVVIDNIDKDEKLNGKVEKFVLDMDKQKYAEVKIRDRDFRIVLLSVKPKVVDNQEWLEYEIGINELCN